jgi:acetyltransferase-like isoleucine patch superfamily enzyme
VTTPETVVSAPGGHQTWFHERVSKAKWAARYTLERAFNSWGTHLPSHRLRQAWLRALGAQIGKNTAIFMGTTVFAHKELAIGDRCVVAERCVLDARGGITLDDDVVLASDVHLRTAEHDPNSPEFVDRYAPIHLSRYSWLGTRSTVLGGVTVEYGGVVAACALAIEDVPEYTVVGGVPARPIAKRNRDLDYDPTGRPLFF